MDERSQVVGLGVVLPYTGLAPLLGFEPLPARFLVFLVAVSGSYLAVVELVKGRVMRRLVGAEGARVTTAPPRG